MKWIWPILLVLAACGARIIDPVETLDPLLTTQTSDPPLSPQLIAALELDVAPWHKPDVPQRIVNIGDAARRRSAEIALAALERLDPEVPQSATDRLWVQFEKASALRELGRTGQARAAFEEVRRMPRTGVMDRYALMNLHALGDERAPGACAIASHRFFGPEKSPMPDYPRDARSGRVEGEVRIIADVRADGSIGTVTVERSTMRIFEQPVIDWVLSRRWLAMDGMPPGAACFLLMPAHFRFKHTNVTVTAAELMPAQRFTFRSIGAAIRYRGEVRQAIVDGKPPP